MRLISSYRGKEKAWEVAQNDFVLGRAYQNSPLLLDLSSDKKLSRLHARIWSENGLHWIEDLQSSRETLLNDVEIKGQGKQKPEVGDVIQAEGRPSVKS
jgi:pSer/pThr/pTyr-binding forkhead associated (FHA) protein